MRTFTYRSTFLYGNKVSKRTATERRDEKKRDRKGKSKCRPINVELTENKEEQKQRGEGGIRGQGSEPKL